MTPLRPLWLLVIAASAALAGFLAKAVMTGAGYTSPVLPLSSVITLIAVGLIVLGLGLIVWRDQRHLRRAAQEQRRGKNLGSSRPARRLHPLQAVRVVAAGQACAYAGALIAGWHAGVLLDLAPATGMGAPNVSSALVMVIGGMLWVIIGFVVETLCRIPPQDGETPAEDPEDGTEEGYAAL